MRPISDWEGPSGGSRDNYSELVSKCKENFAELFAGLPTSSRFAMFDDFEGDVIRDQWTTALGSDSAAVALTESVNGKVRLTTGDSNASLAADGVQLTSFLNWNTANGLDFECLLQVNVITNYQLFVGFTDQRSSLEMPFTLSGTTYTSVATDGFGFLIDTAATTDTIRCVGVANDVDVEHVDSGLAYVAATNKKLRISVGRNNEAKFYIDDVLVATIASITRSSIPLAIVICARAAGDTTLKNVDVDYVAAARFRN